MNWKMLLAGAVCALMAGCGKDNGEPAPEALASSRYFTLEQVAQLLSSVPIGEEQMEEVHDAVSASASNGYDHEYLMESLFSSPGAGIGDSPGTKAAKEYGRPLRDLLREAVSQTKAGVASSAAMLEALENSDVQIYWPYADSWNGSEGPVITFDPGNAGDITNTGYLLSGEKVLVDEAMAKEHPVWVVSNNTDASYTSLEMLRREDPSWGQGGGDIIVRPRTASVQDFKTLVLRSFKSLRQYDSWFAGGSEFFVKMGSVTDMSASTEAELRLYYPAVTDFMIVVKRSQVELEVPFNAILISEWVTGLEKCAFLITEDDGGSTTSWKCDLSVVYNSKKYGVEINLPVRTRDDIVWRGTLTRSYIEKYTGTPVRFGDVELVLELI